MTPDVGSGKPFRRESRIAPEEQDQRDGGGQRRAGPHQEGGGGPHLIGDDATGDRAAYPGGQEGADKECQAARAIFPRRMVDDYPLGGNQGQAITQGRHAAPEQKGQQMVGQGGHGQPQRREPRRDDKGGPAPHPSGKSRPRGLGQRPDQHEEGNGQADRQIDGQPGGGGGQVLGIGRHERPRQFFRQAKQENRQPQEDQVDRRPGRGPAWFPEIPALDPGHGQIDDQQQHFEGHQHRDQDHGCHLQHQIEGGPGQPIRIQREPQVRLGQAMTDQGFDDFVIPGGRPAPRPGQAAGRGAIGRQDLALKILHPDVGNIGMDPYLALQGLGQLGQFRERYVVIQRPIDLPGQDLGHPRRLQPQFGIQHPLETVQGQPGRQQGQDEEHRHRDRRQAKDQRPDRVAISGRMFGCHGHFRFGFPSFRAPGATSAAPRPA